VIDSLRKILEDDALASTLNRSGIPTEKGESWTARRVKAFRRKHQLRAFDEKEKEMNGWLTQEGAATRLEISPMSVSRLVDWEIVPAEQAKRGLPSIILEKNLQSDPVKRAVKVIQTNRCRPLPENPDQLSLFDTTNS